MASSFVQSIGLPDPWFFQFCNRYDVNATTKKILFANDITTAVSIVDLTEEKMEILGISVGQRSALNNGIRELKAIDNRYQPIKEPSTNMRGMKKKLLDIEHEQVLKDMAKVEDSKIQSMLNECLEYIAKVGRKDLYGVDVDDQIGDLKILRYKLNVTWSNTMYKIRKCQIGDTLENSKTKTIFIVGATGSGKTTLIDGMANYIFNVDLKKHDHRIKIVDLTPEEKKNEKKGQSVSQTEWITVYTIPNADKTNTNYTLNIVDTPGFGDTRGIQRDKELVEQVKYFFTHTKEHGVDQVNAICFVAQAPTARLTPTQKYIFHAMLSMFGKDVKDNIYVMATFADGSDPPLLESLKSGDVPYTDWYPFNNSVLFTPRTGSKSNSKISNEFKEMFWNLGKKSFETFFIELDKIKPKSLRLSANVLEEREALTASIDYLQFSIKKICQQLNKIKQEEKVLQLHSQEIAENKDFEYEVDEVYVDTVPVPDGQLTTNCAVCHRTCHSTCAFEDDREKYKCIAMKRISNGKELELDEIFCTVCDNKCHWNKHYNQGYVYELRVKTVKKTYREMQDRFYSGQHKFNDQKEMLQKLKEEKDKIDEELIMHFRAAKLSLDKLRLIALKEDPLSNEGYIKLLLTEEKREAKPGYEDRIKALEEFRQRASFIAMTDTMPSVEKLFETKFAEND